MESTDRDKMQVTPEALDARGWDVIVAGAGPAGSMCALHLADHGRRVLLLDKEEFPREKVCGDGLIADSMNALRRAGLEPEVRTQGHPISLGVIYSPSRHKLDVPGDFMTLKRERLDALIAGGAVRAGAVFARGSVSSIEIQDGGTVACAVKECDTIFHARAAVVATGCITTLASRLGLGEQARPSAIALRQYIKSDARLDEMIISYDRSIVPGYSWIFPMGGGEYNVGCGIHMGYVKEKKPDLRKMYAAFCSEFPEMKRLLDAKTGETPLRSAPLRCGLSGAAAHPAGNVLAIGETIATTFPFTGEGIGKAMESGEMAAESLNDALGRGDFSHIRDFGGTLRNRLADKYIGYRTAERWVAYPWINDFVIKRINKSPRLREAMIGIVNETTDPREIFSAAGILKSFFG